MIQLDGSTIFVGISVVSGGHDVVESEGFDQGEVDKEKSCLLVEFNVCKAY